MVILEPNRLLFDLNKKKGTMHVPVVASGMEPGDYFMFCATDGFGNVVSQVGQRCIKDDRSATIEIAYNLEYLGSDEVTVKYAVGDPKKAIDELVFTDPKTFSVHVNYKRDPTEKSNPKKEKSIEEVKDIFILKDDKKAEEKKPKGAKSNEGARVTIGGPRKGDTRMKEEFNPRVGSNIRSREEILLSNIDDVQNRLPLHPQFIEEIIISHARAAAIAAARDIKTVIDAQAAAAKEVKKEKKMERSREQRNQRNRSSEMSD